MPRMPRESSSISKSANTAGHPDRKEKEMEKPLTPEAPSALLRQQIKNISGRMHRIVTKTLLHPLQSMAAFNTARTDFSRIEDEAYLSCTAMDKSQSIAIEGASTKATYALINALTVLKNEARELAADKSRSEDLHARFRRQLDNVEQLMNASISPFMQSPILSEKGKRQALETLERWAELYRLGLKASGNVPERGEEWLAEAYQRLDLTTAALRQLDEEQEAIATRVREGKEPLPV